MTLSLEQEAVSLGVYSKPSGAIPGSMEKRPSYYNSLNSYRILPCSIIDERSRRMS